MIRLLSVLFLVHCSFAALAQDTPALSPREILDKSVKYHDPEGEWATFSYTLYIQQKLPDGTSADDIVEINLPENYFRYARETTGVEAGLQSDSCFVLSTKTVPCSRILTMRNYYTYLWGLPMKLLDPGTKVLESHTTAEIDGKPCYVLTVPYEKDSWLFFIDKATFALRAYEFYTNTEMTEGERILLNGEFKLGNMRIPQYRRWFVLPSGKLLAEDVLVKAIR